MPKREEISSGIYLTTTTYAGEQARIVYELEVKKDATVTFKADFTGSDNLEIQGMPGSMRKITKVFKGQTVQVAVLQAVDKTRGWKLQCKYQWEEETTVKSKGKGKKGVPAAALARRDSSGGFNNVFRKDVNGWKSGDQVASASDSDGDAADLEAIQNRIQGLMNTGTYGSDAPAPTAGGIVPPPKPPPTDVQAQAHAPVPPPQAPAGAPGTVEGLLASLGLGELASIFEEEALTLDILVDMVRDEKSLRDSLKEIGVARLGHREKIIRALRPYATQ